MKYIRKLSLMILPLILGYFFLSPHPVDASNACVVPPSNMVSWWPGDGNYKDIVGSNNGAPHGNMTFAAGLVGQAFSGNGVDSDTAIIVPNSPSLDVSAGDFSVDAW